MLNKAATIQGKQTDALDDILNKDEKIINSFKIDKWEFIITTKGLYYVGLTGGFKKRKFYKFFPGKYIEGFELGSPGFFNRDIDLKIFVKTNIYKKKNTKTILLSIKKDPFATKSVFEMIKELKKNFT